MFSIKNYCIIIKYLLTCNSVGTGPGLMLFSAENYLGIFLSRKHRRHSVQLLAICVPGKCSKHIEQIGDSIDDIASWKFSTFSLTHSSFNKGMSRLLEFCLDTYFLASLADLCSGVSISRRSCWRVLIRSNLERECSMISACKCCLLLSSLASLSPKGSY